ncbi:MAG: hypothetical protein LBI05_06455 [Planctomycetaceae bacterium]|jgi:hypothetical protein|nr:hypothetical protein [Planctomycetaceae bacterium]
MSNDFLNTTGFERAVERIARRFDTVSAVNPADVVRGLLDDDDFKNKIIDTLAGSDKLVQEIINDPRLRERIARDILDSHPTLIQEIITLLANSTDLHMLIVEMALSTPTFIEAIANVLMNDETLINEIKQTILDGDSGLIKNIADQILETIASLSMVDPDGNTIAKRDGGTFTFQAASDEQFGIVKGQNNNSLETLHLVSAAPDGTLHINREQLERLIEQKGGNGTGGGGTPFDKMTVAPDNNPADRTEIGKIENRNLIVQQAAPKQHGVVKPCRNCVCYRKPIGLESMDGLLVAKVRRDAHLFFPMVFKGKKPPRLKLFDKLTFIAPELIESDCRCGRDFTKEFIVDVFAADDYGEAFTVEVFETDDYGKAFAIDVFGMNDYGQTFTIDVFGNDDIDQTFTIDVLDEDDCGQAFTLDVFGNEDIGQTFTIDVLDEDDCGQAFTVDVFGEDDIGQTFTIDVFEADDMGQAFAIDVFGKDDCKESFTVDMFGADDYKESFMIDVFGKDDIGQPFAVDVFSREDYGETFTVDVFAANDYGEAFAVDAYMPWKGDAHFQFIRGPKINNGNSSALDKGVLLDDGRVMFSPLYQTPIKFYQPPGGEMTASNIGSVGASVSTGSTAQYKYNGCVKLPNGNVVLVPYSADHVRVFKPTPLPGSIIAQVTHGAGDAAFTGGVYVPASGGNPNRVVFVPYCADYVRWYNIDKNEVIRGAAHGQGNYAFAGEGILLPNGKVMFVPNYSSNIGLFDPVTNVYSNGASIGSNRYSNSGGIKLPDGRIMLIPRNNTSPVCYYNPDKNTVTYGGTIKQGSNAFYGGIYLPDYHKVVLLPFTSTVVGIYDLTTDTYSDTIAHGQSKGTSNYYFQGGIYLPEKRTVVLSPRGSDYVGLLKILD